MWPWVRCILLGILVLNHPGMAKAQQAEKSTEKTESDEQRIKRCARLLASHQLAAAPEPSAEPVSNVNPAEFHEIARRRACERSYRFKGGSEKILIASPEEIREDFERFRYLFSYYDKWTESEKQKLRDIPEPVEDENKDPFTNIIILAIVHSFQKSHKDLSFEDVLRLESMTKGIDREQVMLFGRLLLIQSLRLNDRNQEAAQMFKQMRKTLKIQEQKLDIGDENTYFQKQTLRNLIAMNGYAAEAAVSGTLQDDGELIADYLDNREALSPLFGSKWPAIEAADPDSLLLKLSDATRIGLDTAQWDTTHRLSHVVGSFAEGSDTVVFLRGKQGKALHAVAISPEKEPYVMDAPMAAEKLDAYYKREVRTNSTPDMTLFTALKYDDGSYDVQLGDQSFALSSDEGHSLLNGRALPSSHPLTAALTKDVVPKVLYANPLMQYAGNILNDADKFAFALQKSYPTVSIYRDPFTADTLEKVKALHAFSIAGPSEITALVASESFRPKVDDFGVVKEIEENLRQAHVEIVEVKDGQLLNWKKSENSRALIVLTAHSSLALRSFVDKLGKAGVFEGNFVLFNSCETDLTRDLISEINSRYKSAATFSHEGTIKPAQLKSSMIHLVNSLRNGEKVSFGSLLITTFNSHQLNGMWTVSELLGLPSNPVFLDETSR